MSSPVRIVLFGDGAWAANSLARLQETGHRVVAVVVRAQPSDKSLIAAASRFDAPILQPANVNAEEFVQTVAGLDVDLNLSISYNQILRRPVRETARLGSVNFHAGKLPYYRGRNVINWAIINGEIEIGLTAHYIDDGIDTGDLILQRTLPIGWTDTYGDVLCKVVSALPDLVLEAVEMVARGRATRLPQSYLLGTYLPGRETGDEWLDWSDSSRNLHNKVRAITHPGPGARTLLGDSEVIIWRAFYDPEWPGYMATPGQVVGRLETGVLVKTGDSMLLVEEAQIGAGNVETPRWPIGTRLGVNWMAYAQSLKARLQILEEKCFERRDPNDHN